jgi:carbohydrate kinase (thermoresistant glucokinase family)
METETTAQAKLRVVIMGVCGCGKSTVGRLLARELNGTFIDGDDLHPEPNIAKMRSGQALTDQDREPWLHLIGHQLHNGPAVTVVACSALRRRYRDIIRAQAPDTLFIHLNGTRELLASRLDRPGHFMPTSLLDSQLATLEHLEADELGKLLDIANNPAVITAEAISWLHSPTYAQEPIGEKTC